MRIARIAIVVLFLVCLAAAQDDKSKRPSPPSQAQVTLQGKTITVDYSRPKVRDPQTGRPRKIMGEVVPYGEVWRAGANEATSFVSGLDLDINGTNVPAGKYTIFTLPEAGKWTLIISKKTGEWGIPYPGPQDDLARIPMKVETLSQTVDPFTISFDKKSDTEAVMKLAWENTQASVEIKAK